MFKEYKNARYWQQQREAHKAARNAGVANSIAVAALLILFPLAYTLVGWLEG